VQTEAPKTIRVTDQPDRPQPRIDGLVNGGMATAVGRIREDLVLENGVKWILLPHNSKLGAAKGAISVAEYRLQTGPI
jgi:aspartate-semialdehyde dehydrogenase